MRCLLLLSLAAVADSVLTEGEIDPNDLMRRTSDDPPRRYLRPRDDMSEKNKKKSRAFGMIKSFKGQYERGQGRRQEAIRLREGAWNRIVDTTEARDRHNLDGMNQEKHRSNARAKAERDHGGLPENPDEWPIAARVKIANAYRKGAHMAFPRQRVPIGPPAKVSTSKPKPSRYPRKGVTQHKRHPTEHPADRMVKKRNSRVPYHEQQELFRQATVSRAKLEVQEDAKDPQSQLKDYLAQVEQQGGQPANNEDAPEAEVVEAKTTDPDDTVDQIAAMAAHYELAGDEQAAEETQDALEDATEEAAGTEE